MSLEIIRSGALAGVTHGFFTRKGGASSGVFEGLNCGLGSSDQRDIVQINRDRVAQAMDVPPAHLLTVHQVHSADVVTLTEPYLAPPKADALVTATPGIAIATLAADCQPVLFYNPQAQVIGAAHAGWRGALGGVLEATLAAMEQIGARIDQTICVIGPSIAQASYEVGPEFFETFLDQDPTAERYFAQGPNDRLLFDMQGFSLGRLRSAGVAQAEWTRHCTYRDPKRFFSYRRSTHEKRADYGRLISAIRL